LSDRSAEAVQCSKSAVKQLLLLAATGIVAGCGPSKADVPEAWDMADNAQEEAASAKAQGLGTFRRASTSWSSGWKSSLSDYFGDPDTHYVNTATDEVLKECAPLVGRVPRVARVGLYSSLRSSRSHLRCLRPFG